jgi:hypothetical protein
MRIYEIADANEQVALFKLINDSVWAALAKQQQLQAAQKKASKQRLQQNKVAPAIQQPTATQPRKITPGPMLANPVTQNTQRKLG